MGPSALELRAREHLDRGTYDFFAGGADDEVTLRGNEAAWEQVALWPHILRDVSSPDTTTTLLGLHVATPIAVAPIGYLGLAHPDGEAAVASGAAAAGALRILSTRSSTPIEDVAPADATSPWWMQLYVMRDRSRTFALADRAVAGGCGALVLTADTPVLGRKLRNEANRWSVPADHELAGSDEGAEQDPSLTLSIVGEVAARYEVPVVVKGVLRADDARRCVDAGAAGIVVSNHGGRQLDTAPPTARALRRVVEAVGDDVEVHVDGGIRRGTDVVKALAMGARAVWVGRPIVWGLVDDGAAGVASVLDSFRAELVRAMALCGTARVADISADLLSG